MEYETSQKVWTLEKNHKTSLSGGISTTQYSKGRKKIFSKKYRFLCRIEATVSMNKINPKNISLRPFYANKIRIKVGNIVSLMLQRRPLYSKIRVFWQATQPNVAIRPISDYAYRNRSHIFFQILPIILNGNDRNSLKKAKTDIWFYFKRSQRGPGFESRQKQHSIWG